jgi:hypothetical protein
MSQTGFRKMLKEGVPRSEVETKVSMPALNPADLDSNRVRHASFLFSCVATCICMSDEIL